MNPADDFSQLGVSGGGYCASVEQGHVAGFKLRGLLPSFFEHLPLERGAIGLVGTASEVKNTKETHRTSIVLAAKETLNPFWGQDSSIHFILRLGNGVPGARKCRNIAESE